MSFTLKNGFTSKLLNFLAKCRRAVAQSIGVDGLQANPEEQKSAEEKQRELGIVVDRSWILRRAAPVLTVLEESWILPLELWAVAVGKLFVDHDSDLGVEAIEQALPVLFSFCSASAFICDTHAFQTVLPEPPLLGQDKSHSWPREQRGKNSQRFLKFGF